MAIAIKTLKITGTLAWAVTRLTVKATWRAFLLLFLFMMIFASNMNRH